MLQVLNPEHVEVEICRAEELDQRRGLTSELDEMWSYVRSKANPRWLWHAIDHHTGKVLAYVFGRRKDNVFLKLQKLLEPFGITKYYTDCWGPMNGISRLRSITWARRICKRSRASTSICGPGSSGWFVARSAFRKQNGCTIW